MPAKGDYRRRRKAGLCGHCESPARPGRALCAVCAGRMKKHQDGLVARGLCRVCGKHGRPGKNYCAECTEKKRDRELTQRYGISSREYDVLLARQGGGCAICGSVPLPGGLRSASRLNVDHGHSTNRVRGLLCHRCNMGLGYFGDDPTRLRVAALYVAAKRRAPTLSDVLRAEHELVGVGGGSWAALEEHLDGCSCDACHVSGKEGPA